LKTIFRVLIIVLVIGVISLGIYWIVERNSGSQTGILSSVNGAEVGDFQRGDHEQQFDGAQPPDGARGNGTLPEGFGDRGHDEFGAGYFGWHGILRSLGIVAATTLVVILIQKGFAFLKRRKKLQAAA